MKISFDIDCTPEEARAFLGLPEVAPLQQRLLEELEQRMRTNLEKMDGEALFKTWMPLGTQAFEQMQKAFWSRLSQGAKTGDDAKRAK